MSATAAEAADGAASFAKEFAYPCGDALLIADLLAGRRLSTLQASLSTALSETETQSAQGATWFGEVDASPWQPGIGIAEHALRGGDFAFAALQTASACAMAGAPTRVRVQLESRRRLFVDGSLVPVEGDVEFAADSHRIELSQGAGSMRFERVGNRWIPTLPVPNDWPLFDGAVCGPRFIAWSGLFNTSVGFPWPGHGEEGTILPRPSDIDRRVVMVQEGAKLIALHAPAYAAWLDGCLYGCVLIERGEGNRARSNGSFDYPGIVAIDPPPTACESAEILLTECCRQQMFAYLTLTSIVEPGTGELLYSSPRRTYQPAERLLANAHVTANLILCMRQLLSAGVLDNTGLRRYDMLRLCFNEEHRPLLRKSRTLTTAGRTLWRYLDVAVG